MTLCLTPMFYILAAEKEKLKPGILKLLSILVRNNSVAPAVDSVPPWFQTKWYHIWSVVLLWKIIVSFLRISQAIELWLYRVLYHDYVMVEFEEEEVRLPIDVKHPGFTNCFQGLGWWCKVVGMQTWEGGPGRSQREHSSSEWKPSSQPADICSKCGS